MSHSVVSTRSIAFAVISAFLAIVLALVAAQMESSLRYVVVLIAIGGGGAAAGGIGIWVVSHRARNLQEAAIAQEGGPHGTR